MCLPQPTLQSWRAALALRLLGNSVKWDRKPPKEPELRNLLDSFPRSPGNPENHFQMQPRTDAACREKLGSTQTSPAPLLCPSQLPVFFFFLIHKDPSLTAKLYPKAVHCPSLSPLSDWKTQDRGNQRANASLWPLSGFSQAWCVNQVCGM